jgi:hypothetical protein
LVFRTALGSKAFQVPQMIIKARKSKARKSLGRQTQLVTRTRARSMSASALRLHDDLFFPETIE